MIVSTLQLDTAVRDSNDLINYGHPDGRWVECMPREPSRDHEPGWHHSAPAGRVRARPTHRGDARAGGRAAAGVASARAGVGLVTDAAAGPTAFARMRDSGVEVVVAG
jgi:hypothetical protein